MESETDSAQLLHESFELSQIEVNESLDEFKRDHGHIMEEAL